MGVRLRSTQELSGARFTMFYLDLAKDVKVSWPNLNFLLYYASTFLSIQNKRIVGWNAQEVCQKSWNIIEHVWKTCDLEISDPGSGELTIIGVLSSARLMWTFPLNCHLGNWNSFRQIYQIRNSFRHWWSERTGHRAGWGWMDQRINTLQPLQQCFTWLMDDRWLIPSPLPLQAGDRLVDIEQIYNAGNSTT